MSSSFATDADYPFVRLVLSCLAESIGHGLVVVEASQSMVRLSRGDVEIDVYWGRSSYEVGAEITICGERYSLSEFIRLKNPQLASVYRHPTAVSLDQLGFAVSQVTSLLKRYGVPDPGGVEEMASALQRQRSSWSREYALASLARLTRPAAEEAFRSQDYAKAAELYARIAAVLSKAELRKYEYAKARSSAPH